MASISSQREAIVDLANVAQERGLDEAVLPPGVAEFILVDGEAHPLYLAGVSRPSHTDSLPRPEYRRLRPINGDIAGEESLDPRLAQMLVLTATQPPERNIKDPKHPIRAGRYAGAVLLRDATTAERRQHAEQIDIPLPTARGALGGLGVGECVELLEQDPQNPRVLWPAGISRTYTALPAGTIPTRISA